MQSIQDLPALLRNVRRAPCGCESVGDLVEDLAVLEFGIFGGFDESLGSVDV